MKILITGGTGFIGTKLTEALTGKHHQVSILTRSKNKTSENRYVDYLTWDGQSFPRGIGIYDAVINLAGAGIADKRWSPSRKKLLIDSRIQATKACVEFINNSPNPPQVFISASAIGYYGSDSKSEVSEDSPAGDDFPAKLCVEWEQAAKDADTRTVFPRIGIVLGAGGGFMEKVEPIYRLYLGGVFGSGNQGFPWIHIDDIVGALVEMLENDDYEGPYNLVGPQLVNQRAFSRKLAEAVDTKDFWVIPKFMLDLIFGEQALIFWGGQNAVPKRLLDAGYSFKFPEAKPALEQVVNE
ncbi:TIGR01777 family oxidoreductase [Pontibacter sp. G13]|uniref:TIGR01777 family oxidoreductase n=1 Tax=Pontibacter sp. G13 TaxID=3074898 RepID=UPI00288B68E0|nr:TIGR01777 family oxidoreductase [Pontibacter sp. G13]WNJ21470.1 TIGR01777 family oxidoreductase [Pontibacter sp. G13]